MKRLNHSGSNNDAYLASSLRQAMCMSSPVVRLIILITTPFILFSGAQVGVASLAVNFIVAQGIGIDASKASQLFSFCQLTFTFGRYAPFIGEG